MDQEGIKIVYTGSCVHANFIKSILTDNGINCMVQDTLNESIRSGFASGSPDNACRVFVDKEMFELADKLYQRIPHS